MATDPEQSKEGWATGDVLSRGHGDRWNTEGGRWTEERQQAEEKEYVPKNARWNDEERAERWRSTGGRGEGATRGRGQPPRGQGRRSISDVHTLPELNGLHSADHIGRKKRADDGRTKYNKRQLLNIYDKLQEKMGPVLTLPKGVDTSYQFLFKSAKNLSAEEELPPKKAEVPVKTPDPPVDVGVAGIGPDELEADSWVYKDPFGQVQGPFSKQEVLAWWEEGYFPEDLPVQSQLSAKENWVPLEKLLKLWDVPMERREDAMDSRPKANDPPRKLEGCDSLATVGSHISSSLLPEVNVETLEDHQSSQPPANVQMMMQSFSSQPQHVQQQQQQQQQAQAPFQNPVSDLQQTMHSMLLQRQKQNQQAAAAAANVGGLNFSNPSLGGAGLSGLRQGVPFQQNNPFMGAYGLQQQQQQQRPAGLQDNPLLTPGILEALQHRLNVQPQNLNRGQMQSTPYGYEMNSGMGNSLQGQLQGNPGLAALLNQNQNQMAQRNNEQRAAMSPDLQRFLQARSLQAQGNSYGGMNNPLSAAGFGGGMRAPYAQQQQQAQQQNPWNQMQGGYGALNSLLQQRPQQMNQQQQLAQAMLLNKLQGMRFPNQQLGVNRPPVPNRENLLSLAALQGGDVSLVDQLNQQRQRNNMSPPNPAFQSQVDPNFALMGQSTAPSSLPSFSYPNQKQPPFPQHILQQLTSGSDLNASAGPEPNKTASPPTLSLDSVSRVETTSETQPKTSPVGEQRSKLNAWGVAPAPTSAASLLEIQEQESKTAQQNAVSKDKQPSAPAMGPAPGGGWNVQHAKPKTLVDIMRENEENPAMGTAPGGGWNVQHVKPKTLVDIMREDEEKRQAQAMAQLKQQANQQQQQQQQQAAKQDPLPSLARLN